MTEQQIIASIISLGYLHLTPSKRASTAVNIFYDPVRNCKYFTYSSGSIRYEWHSTYIVKRKFQTPIGKREAYPTELERLTRLYACLQRSKKRQLNNLQPK